jgi:hypothetical protein
MTDNDDGVGGNAMTCPQDFGLIPPGGGPDEPDPEWDLAWNWWDGMRVQDIVTGAWEHRSGKHADADED